MPDMQTPVTELPPFNCAVFASGASLALVHLEADNHESASADAAARGYELIGAIGVNAGVPKVTCEPGPYAVTMMPLAGATFADLFGKYLAAHQIAQANKKG